MFIMTEETPNPSAMKFLPGRAVLAQGVADFTSSDAAATSPLAKRLFAIGGAAQAASAEPDSAVVVEIKRLIDKHVRPTVVKDGGDIAYQDFQNGVVYLQMHGSCAGCPSSTATLKLGIERLLRHYLPEVQEVRAVA